MATQDDLFARDDIKRIVEKAKQTTKPVLGHSLKLMRDTAQQIEGKEGPNVRPTSSYKNIEKLSQVERDMGYEKRFQVKGIDSPGRVAEIRLLISKKAPNVENFMTQRGVDWEAYNRALKRFRLTVLEPLIKQNPKAMDILTSPAYLDQFAAETRQNMINNPKLRTIYGIEKVFDKKSREMKWKVPQWAINIENQKLGYIFQSANPRGGLPPGGKVQSKFYQMAQGFWKKFSANMPKEMKALKNVNFKLAINEVDKMLTTAKTALQKKQAIMALTALLTSISKGTFGASLMGISKATGAYNILLGAGAISDVLTPTDFLGSKEKDEYVYLPVEEKVEPAPIERFNRGGIMDINYMTRPLGYAMGGDVLDKIRELDSPVRRLKPGENVFDEEGNYITTLPGNISDQELERVIRDLEVLVPRQRLYDSDGNIVPRGQVSDYEMTEMERAYRNLVEIEKRLSQGDLTENEAEVLRKEKQRIMGLSPFDRLFEDVKRKYSLSPGQALYDSEGNLITEAPAGQVSDFEQEQILKLMPGQALYDRDGNLITEKSDLLNLMKTPKALGPMGQVSDYEQEQIFKLSPGQTAYDAEGNVVTENPLPYDPDKGYTENLNELMTDIGGTLKEKIFGAGRSLRDKIKDFAKYGWGDKEDYMEIGGRQVDPDDPNFRRFIEDNYMGEGESYIEGIENYRREVEGFRRGGIVSINRMTRTL